MRNILVVSGFFALSVGQAMALPGDLYEEVRSGIISGAQECGLTAVSGFDYRLPSAIRARRAERVIAGENADGSLFPVMLVEVKLNGGSKELKTVYSKPNGSFQLSVARDYSFNDLELVTARGGRIAFTQTENHSGEFVTFFVIRENGRYLDVSPDEFDRYVRDWAIGGFVDSICGAS